MSALSRAFRHYDVDMEGNLASVVAVAVLLLLPSAAEAAAGALTGPPAVAPLTVSLEYSAPAACPGIDDYKAVVVGRLGYDPFREAVSDRVQVHIGARGRVYEGRIEWRDAQGKWAGDRAFQHSDDCSELVRAMGFALALQIQLSAAPGASSEASPSASEQATQAVESPPTPPAANPQPKETPVSEPVPVNASASVSPPPRIVAGLGSLVGYGLSPTAVPFARAFGGLQWSASAIEVAAEAAWPSTVRRADGGGFSQQLLLLGIAGCGLLPPWSACLIVKGGAIRVVGKDVDHPASSVGPILESGLRLSLIQPFGRYFYVAGRAEALVVVTRWSVTLDQSEVWASSRFSETLGLDFGLRFR